MIGVDQKRCKPSEIVHSIAQVQIAGSSVVAGLSVVWRKSYKLGTVPSVYRSLYRECLKSQALSLFSGLKDQCPL